MSSLKVSPFVASSLGITKFKMENTNHLWNHLQRNSRYSHPTHYRIFNFVSTSSIIDKQGDVIGVEVRCIYKNHDSKKRFFSAEQIHYHRTIKSHIFWAHAKDGRESEIFDIQKNEKPILIAPFFDEGKSYDLLKEITISQIITVEQ